MSLNIKDRRTDELARRLASLTGQSITEAVRNAIEERLEREERKRNAEALSAELLEIGRRCAEAMGGTAHSLDHGDFLYDEIGLPK